MSTQATPSESIPEPQSATHCPLPVAIAAFDYLLTLLFLLVGPFFFYSEAIFATGYSRLGESVGMTVQLGLHFLVAYYFLTNHYMEPMTPEVRMILTAWRVLMLVGMVLLAYGFQQYRAPFL